MSWRSGGPGLKYKWQFDSPTFAGPVMINIPSGSDGFDTTSSVVNSALDGMLQTLGVARGDSILGQWRAYAFAGPTDSTASSETRALTLRRVGTLPLNETFDGTTYPPVEWALTGTGTQYWTRELVPGYGSGVASTKYNFYNAQATTGIQQLISNQFPPAAAPNNYLRFNYAGAYYSATAIDSMVVETSADGGTTWVRLIGMYQSASLTSGVNNSPIMSTVNLGSAAFTPAANQWGTKIFPMPIGTNKVRFTAKSAYGNNLFIDNVTAGLITGTGTPLSLVPDKYELSQNYPNPFNPTTKINFSIPKQGFVTLKVFDVTGREVANLINAVTEAGYHSVDFNAVTFASGVYFYRIEAADFIDTKRMVLVK